MSDPVLGAYGTIGAMSDHRVRLTDEEASLIVSALRARMAMSGKARREKLEHLVLRLEEMSIGNPFWRFKDWHSKKASQ